MRISITSILGICIGIVPFVLAYSAARESTNSGTTIDGIALRHPIEARKTGTLILERNVSFDDILSERGYARPSPDAPASGCPSRAGIAWVNSSTVVLIGPTPWGLLVEYPGRGIAVLEDERANKFSKKGSCTPLPRQVSP